MLAHTVSVSLFLDPFHLCLSALLLRPLASYTYLFNPPAHFLRVGGLDSFVFPILGVIFLKDRGYAVRVHTFGMSTCSGA